MLEFPPDRISGLIERIETGQPISQDEVNRLALLQALDCVKLGQDFAKSICETNQDRNTQLELLN